MTNLDDRYRLLKCVALGGGIRTHNAQDTSTGRPVMVHILDGAESEAVERLRGQVGALATPDRSRILEMSATDGGLVIVSEILIGLTSFQDWLDARSTVAIPAAKPPTPEEPTDLPDPAEPPLGPSAQPTASFVVGRIASIRSTPPKGVEPAGEFTQLFQGLEGPPTPIATPSAPKASTSPVAGPPAKPVASPPISPPPPPPPPRKSAAAPPSAPPAPLEPGEFTSMFRPLAPPPPQQMERSPLMGGPGRSSEPASGAPFRPAAPPPPQPPPFGGSSSAAFAAPRPPAAPPSAPSGPTLGSLGSPHGQPAPSMPFGASSAPTAPSPSASPLLGGTPSPLGASGASNASLPPVIAPPVFSSAGSAGGAGAQGSRSPLADQRAAGPSDFTMLIRQSATPAPPVVKPSAPAPAAPPAEPRRSIPLGLIIALNVVLLLAIALVLYFVFRPAPPNVTPGGPAPALKTPAVPSAPAVKAPTIPNASSVKP